MRVRCQKWRGRRLVLSELGVKRRWFCFGGLGPFWKTPSRRTKVCGLVIISFKTAVLILCKLRLKARDVLSFIIKIKGALFFFFLVRVVTFKNVNDYLHLPLWSKINVFIPFFKGDLFQCLYDECAKISPSHYCSHVWLLSFFFNTRVTTDDAKNNAVPPLCY